MVNMNMEIKIIFLINLPNNYIEFLTTLFVQIIAHRSIQLTVKSMLYPIQTLWE